MQAIKHLTETDWKQIADVIVEAWAKYIDYISCETNHWEHIIDALTIKEGESHEDTT